MRSPVARFAINFTVYLVFGGAILAFVTRDVAEKTGAIVSFGTILAAALGVALWSGALTTAIETRVMPLPVATKRAGVAAALGALNLGGFAAILSVVAWGSLQLGFVAIGLVAGALMQAARAFSLGGIARDDDGDGPMRAAATRTDEPRTEEGGMDAKQLIANGALAIDVRTKDEWDGGHLPQAKHVPVDEIAGRVDDVEQWAGGKDKPIVVYCAMGGRAGRARSALLAAGFTNVVNGGGYSSLK